MNKPLCEYMFLILLSKYLELELVDHIEVFVLLYEKLPNFLE